MASTVGDLIKDHQLTVVTATATVEEALRLMDDGDYSQLPVIGEDGRAIGLFTEKQIATAVRMGLGCDILQAQVSRWMDAPVRIVSPHWRVNDVAGMFSDALAVIVGEHNELLGIVTQYDIAAYLAEWSKGIALVEDIEKQLRGFISRILPTGQAQSEALNQAFGAVKQDPNKPAVAYAEMTLQEHIQLIVTDGNWQRFEPYFHNKVEFRKVMDAARKVRNDVAHFRGKLTAGQLQTLKSALQWLRACTRVAESEATLSKVTSDSHHQ